ncbi:MAG: hypothetical protein ACUVRM_12125 [Bacillota bacterium]
MIDNEYMNNLFILSLDYLRDNGAFDSETFSKWQAWWKEKAIFPNLEAVQSCISKFIDAEMDYLTKGDRGIGRMTTVYPRFAAYYRKQVSRLDQKQCSTLRDLFQDVILCAYIAHTCVSNRAVEGRSVPLHALFEEWIPVIYGGEPFLSEAHSQVIMVFTAYAFTQLVDFLDSLRIKRQKKGSIFVMYAVAGWKLRAVEESIAEAQLPCQGNNYDNPNDS